MSDPARNILEAPLRRLLRPLVRILLRNGITLRCFSELARSVFVEVADEAEFRIPRRKQSDSRIAVITGLTRKEVRRLRADPHPNIVSTAGHNRAARVVEGWANDPDFRDDDGPRQLALEGAGGFADLVRRYSGDAPPRAVFDELERVGVAQRVGAASVVLVAETYDPIRNEAEDLRRLGEGVGRVLDALDQDLSGREGAPSVHWVESTAPIAAAAAAVIEQESLRRNAGLLEAVAGQLASADRDLDGDGEIVGTLVAQFRRRRSG